MNQNNNSKASSSSSTSLLAAGDDCIANEAISIKLPNSDALLYGKALQITSTVVEIGGLAWQMKIRKVQNPTAVTGQTTYMYVHCNEQVKDRLWQCKVQFTVQSWMEGVEEKPPFYSHSFGQFYGFNGHSWIFPIDGIQHHPKIKMNSKMEIRLQVKVFHMLEKSLPTLDTGLLVNMGEGHSETLFVNKYTMAGLSNYFRNFFFGEQSAGNGNCFELNETENFNIGTFKTMIYSAMTLGATVQESNMLDYKLALELIKQSAKFDFPLLSNYCEKFLIDTKDSIRHLPVMQLLGLADQFNLVQLKEHCLKKISSVPGLLSRIDYISGRTNQEVYSRLSEATKEELRTNWDGKIDFTKCHHSKMALLEVADQFKLVKLKQQCLDEMNLLDYLAEYRFREIHNGLGEDTQEVLRELVDGKAGELRDLTEKLRGGVQANKSKGELVEHINKLAEAVLGRGRKRSAAAAKSSL